MDIALVQVSKWLEKGAILFGGKTLLLVCSGVRWSLVVADVLYIVESIVLVYGDKCLAIDHSLVSQSRMCQISACFKLPPVE